MKIKNIYLSLLTMLLLCGCYEDKGNYDYNAIGNVTIGNVEERYLLQKFEQLQITPNVKSEGITDDTPLAYSWEIDGKIVSEEKTLDYTVINQFRDNEDYYCRLIVENTANQAKYFKEFKLAVITPYNSGVFVLAELADGSANLAFVSTTNGNKGDFVDGVFEIENELSMKGKPLSIEETEGSNFSRNHIFINTSKGGYCTSLDFMKMTKLYDGSVMLRPEDDLEFERLTFRNYDGYDYGAALNTKGQLYPIRGLNKMFSLPSPQPIPVYNKPEEAALDYQFSKYWANITVGWGGQPSGILAFDDKEGRFMRLRSVYGTEDNDQMVNADVRATIGGKMLFMEMIDWSYNHCSVIHDGAFNSFKLIPKHTTGYALTTLVYDLIDSKMNAGSKFVVSKDKSMLYYTSGSKFYRINLQDPSKEYLSEEFTISGLPAGATLNFVKFRSPYSDDYLLIGVTNNGVDEIYKVKHLDLVVEDMFSGYSGKAVDVYIR